MTSSKEQRAALVTGGSSGIGFSIALAARRPEKVAAAAPELDAHAVEANLAHDEACARVVAEHIEQYSRLDVLVNSAGIGIGGNVEALTPKQLDLQLDVNLRALYLVTQAAIPHLRTTKGLVVNLASIAGTLPTGGLAAYGATKAAVIALTRSLNEELEPDGIRVSAISPGFVDTPMTTWTGLPGDEQIQPEDIAEIVRLLLRLSPRARIPNVVVERLGESGA